MAKAIRSFFDLFRLPLLFSAAVLLAYGIPIFLGWLSFYGDDWIYVYNNHLMGPASFPAFVAWDRPHSAWIYMLSGALFGESPLPYHLLLLAERWLAVFLFWRILRAVWPSAQRMVSWAVLLFAVYPGFRQQPIAVQFILHFASLDLCLFSIWCMLRTATVRTNRSQWLLTILGFGAATLALFSCEYFVGLEVLRPFLLWFFILNRLRKQLPETQSRMRFFLRTWIPYVAASLFFLIWRVFIFSFQTYQPKLLDKLTENPLAGLREVGTKILRDLITVCLTVWRKTLNQPTGRTEQITYFALIAGVFLLCLWALRAIRDTTPANAPEQTSEKLTAAITKQILLCGVIALLAGGIPFWATLLDVETSFPWDRSTIAFSPGVALLAAPLIALIFRSLPQLLAVAALTALAIGAHFANATVYRDEALKMNDYFWQLAWRAPGLEEGTILVSDQIPLNRTSDGDLTPVVNWQYAPDLSGNRYQYKYFDLDLRESQFFSDPQPGQEISHDYRSHTFRSNMDKVLAIFYREKSCLWVVTETERDYPGLPESLWRLAAISNPELILTDPIEAATPPAPIGAEPEHTYCYYFQKTSLALQRQEATEALEFARNAIDADLEPFDPVDWIPLIKAFVINQEWEQAGNLSEKIGGNSGQTEFLCRQLTALDTDKTQPAYAALLQRSGCGNIVNN